MAEISIWKVIKVCIIILLLLIVVKKILKVWREHKREQKLIDDAAYRNQIYQQQLGTAQMHRDNFAAVTAPVTGVAAAAMAPPVYANPVPMYGGADDFEDPDFEDMEAYDEGDDSDSEEYDSDEEETMTGGSFFDILSKIKAKPKKKSSSKAKPKKKSTSKAKPKKKTSSKKKGKK